MLSQFFTELATGLTSFIPAFFQAVVLAFEILFMNPTTADGVTTYSGINPVGEVALAFIVMGIVYKILPIVAGWLRMTIKKYRRARAIKRARA